MLEILLIIIVLFLLNYLTLGENYYDSSFYIKESQINGNGIFSKNKVKSGDTLFKAINDKKRVTLLGKFINHCNIPNSYLRFYNNEYYLYALNDICEDEEITANYDDTPYFIKNSKKEWTC